MAISYPTSIDTLTNPLATEVLGTTATIGIAALISNLNDIVEALEAKVGIDSSATTTSHDYKLSGVTGTDKAVSKTGTETLTNKTLTSPKINENVAITATATEINYTDGVTSAIQTQIDNHLADTTTHGTTGAIVGLSDTQTLTNKRITKRTGTTTSSATPTINTDNVDFYSITAQAEAISSFTTNLTGTPTEAQILWIAITGTAARAITWGTSFEASTIPLPTTTVTTARLDVGFVWNSITNKWRCVAAV